MIYKIANTAEEYEQIFKLNYETFVEEIPQHEKNETKKLKDKLEKIKPISFERNKDNGNYTALRAKISNKEYLIEMKEIEYVT